MSEIKSIRKRVDKVDEEILGLLAERMKLAKAAGKEKRKLGKPVLDPEREAELLSNASSKADAKGMNPEDVRAIFKSIMIMGRRAQGEEIHATFLGPKGTFADEAARRYFSQVNVDLQPSMSVPEVFRSVESGEFAYGVVPVENSSEGSINVTLDLLMESTLNIYGEIELQVRHNLIVKPGTDLKNLKVILSHPQGLSQCRFYLEEHYPQAELRETSSTAKAVELLAEIPDGGAIGMELAAELYGMLVVARGIQDNPRNFTRFLVLSGKEHPKTKRNKTSIVYSLEHKPGALYRALGVFANSKVNITRIESRPAKQRPWEYVFFLDFEGHVEDPVCARLMRDLGKKTTFLRALGSYPAWTGQEGQA
jgi:chorismate mutase/prephenate dehydratase